MTRYVPRFLRFLWMTAINLSLMTAGAALVGAASLCTVAVAVYATTVWDAELLGRVLFFGLLALLVLAPIVLTYFLIRVSFRIFSGERTKYSTARKRRLLLMYGAFVTAYVGVVMLASIPGVNLFIGVDASEATWSSLRQAMFVVLDNVMKGALLDLAESFDWNILSYEPSNAFGGALVFHMRSVSSLVLVNILKLSWDEAETPLSQRRDRGGRGDEADKAEETAAS